MGKFQQINTELLPLIYVENWFLCSIFGIFWLIFFKLCIEVDILGRSGGDCKLFNFVKNTIAFDLKL